MHKYTFNFTQAKIRNLPAPASGRIEYYDEQMKKLRLRVSSTGNKSFLIVKWKNGRAHRVTLGNAEEITVTEARRLAMEALTIINQGGSPTEERKRLSQKTTTLSQMLEQYIEHNDIKESTSADYRKKIKQGYEPWLDKPLTKINEKMVLDRFRWITANKGKTTANNSSRVLRLTINYAHVLSIIDNVPTSILSRARAWHKNNRKDRVIPSSKLQAWHKAVEALPSQKAKVYLLTALYMGFRSTEILTIEWSHIDMNGKSITLYDTKNHTNHRLPIPEVLIPHINNLRELTGNHKWVFEGAKAGKPMTTPLKQIKAVINASDTEFSPHDLRRTFATIAEAINLPMSMIKRLMNHITTNDVTSGYIVTEEETLRVAINKVADYIQSRVTQNDNLIQLHGNKVRTTSQEATPHP